MKTNFGEYQCDGEEPNKQRQDEKKEETTTKYC